jgi:hypothetical protein
MQPNKPQARAAAKKFIVSENKLITTRLLPAGRKTQIT